MLRSATFSRTTVARMAPSVRTSTIRVRASMRQVKVMDRRLSTYALQSSLPKLPVPPLAETLERYRDWCGTLLASDQERSALDEAVQEFGRPGGIGHELQAKLEERAANAPTSWLEDWWQAAYVEFRAPVPINVNYSFVFEKDAFVLPQHRMQTNRAARLVHAALQFKAGLDREELPPDMEGPKTPLCMCQYPYLFSATRIPGEKADTVAVNKASRYITVAHRQRFYKVNVTDDQGSPLPVSTIESRLLAVKQSSSAPYEAPVGALTAMDRDTFFRLRTDLASSPRNAESFSDIEGGILLLCLDDDMPSDFSSVARSMLHGDGRNRWFDKSVQLIVTENGNAGFNCEHSMMDGTTTCNLASYMTGEASKSPVNVEESTHADVQGVSSIDFTFNDEQRKSVQEALHQVDKLINGNELIGINFDEYGKNFIKQCRVSPDAFVQIAYQLAYFSLHGRTPSTYESASVKRFLHGRTETMRPTTNECSAFVRAAVERGGFTASAENPVVCGEASSDLAAMIRAAGAAHVDRLKLCKAGHGVDRHLLGLHMIFKEQYAAKNVPVPRIFSDPSYGTFGHIVVSTSNLSVPGVDAFAFGPVAENCYGIGYSIGSNALRLCVASRSEYPESDTGRFAAALHGALRFMASVFHAEAGAGQRARL